MALKITDLTTIKNWFKTGLKPTQTQFWSTWDSFWHKSESLPISSINGLGGLLDGKAEENHEHNQYATNDATSLTADNVTAWQQKLGVADLKFDDKAITTTQDYAEFGLDSGATINAFNNAIYTEVAKKLDAPTENATDEYVLLADGSTAAKGDLGKNFSNTDLEVSENRKHTGTASVELAMPMIYSNASQRFPGLVDKTGDTTFNQVAVFDGDGNLAKASLTSSEAVKTVNGVEPDEDGNIDVTIAESQIIKDDNDNLITEYVRDNPNLFEISGQRNIILSTYTDNPISVTGSGNFLQGGGHSILDWYSAAFGQNHTIGGSYSTAFGVENVILESYSVAFGTNNIVRVGYSSAFGSKNTVNGSHSFAFGSNNTTEGNYSTAFGSNNIVNVNNSSAFGSYNKAYNINKGDDIPGDLCFSIGIGYAGPGGQARMNALSVFRNGEAWFDELTVDKIENSKSNKVAITKEYLDLRVPTPPETGCYTLQSNDGIVSWVSI